MSGRQNKRRGFHIDNLTNHLLDIHPELGLDLARSVATSLMTDPPAEVLSAMSSSVLMHRPRKILKAGDKRHGTLNGFTNYGCRCEPCCRAAAEEAVARKSERAARGLPEGDQRHGTYNGYTNWGCRCVLCKQAAHDRYVEATSSRA